jgi:pimeloyl-ACP methyl ester carboxylesterase
MKLNVVALGISLVVGGAEPCARADDDGEQRLRCERVTFAVSLAEGAPLDQTLVAHLCARGELHHKTMQIVIHGGTYDHNYWDWPFQPEVYSYVRDATDAGYATLNLDRLGVGESSRPTPGVALTLHTAAHTVHQIVTELRGGGLVAPGFGRVHSERIMLVGHSMGSVTASIEAATYHDVDGVVLSAYSHSIGPGNAVAISSLYPAPFDPKFAALGLPTDYFTTVPGARGVVFYSVPDADPQVIALDEVLKQTTTLGEVTDIQPSLSLSPSITVPTLITVGDLDRFMCAPPSCTAAGFLSSEPTFFGPHACAEAAVVPNAGHDVNLHRSAPTFFAIVREWAARRVGASTKEPPPQPCP